MSKKMLDYMKREVVTAIDLRVMLMAILPQDVCDALLKHWGISLKEHAHLARTEGSAGQEAEKSANP
jgi:hypothetical protein